MKVTFTGRQLVVTPALREFTEERLDKLQRVMEGISEAHVILAKEKYRHIAEIVVQGKQIKFSATQATEDMYSSIGKTLDKIEHQVKKHRDKLILSKRRRPGRKGENGNLAAVVEEEVVGTLADGKMMVRDEDFRRKPMTPEEAALLLQDAERAFVVFRDAGTQGIGVVYRRDDGHVGLILPQA